MIVLQGNICLLRCKMTLLSRGTFSCKGDRVWVEGTQCFKSTVLQFGRYGKKRVFTTLNDALQLEIVGNYQKLHFATLTKTQVISHNLYQYSLCRFIDILERTRISETNSVFRKIQDVFRCCKIAWFFYHS